MKIKLMTAWVSNCNYDNSEGSLEIENVGRQEIRCPLPESIIRQIEEFYISEYNNRMKKVMEAL